jgi:hypothetical protein
MNKPLPEFDFGISDVSAPGDAEDAFGLAQFGPNSPSMIPSNLMDVAFARASSSAEKSTIIEVL